MNEVYRMALHYIDIAKRQEKSMSMCFVKPSNQGKSHTAQIIARDTGAYIIPPMSISVQKNWFANHLDTPFFIFDDPSDWSNILDREHVMTVIKNMLSGSLKGGRATKFDENIPYPLETKVAIIFFMNDEQYSDVIRTMSKVGILSRTQVFFVKHTDNCMQRIENEYLIHKYSIQNLPKFRVNGDNTFPEKFIASGKTKVYYSEDIIFEEVNDNGM